MQSTYGPCRVPCRGRVPRTDLEGFGLLWRPVSLKIRWQVPVSTTCTADRPRNGTRVVGSRHSCDGVGPEAVSVWHRDGFVRESFTPVPRGQQFAHTRNQIALSTRPGAQRSRDGHAPLHRSHSMPCGRRPCDAPSHARIDIAGAMTPTMSIRRSRRSAGRQLCSAEPFRNSSQEMFQSVQPLAGSSWRLEPLTLTTSPMLELSNIHALFSTLMPTQP